MESQKESLIEELLNKKFDSNTHFCIILCGDDSGDVCDCCYCGCQGGGDC